MFFKFQLIYLIQTIVIFIFSIGCLIELKFCEVSRNSISNRCWKFQLSILKNKKVLFLKKYFLSRTAMIDPKDGVSRPNFQWRFCLFADGIENFRYPWSVDVNSQVDAKQSILTAVDFIIFWQNAKIDHQPKTLER